MNDSSNTPSWAGLSDDHESRRPYFSVIIPVFNSLPYLTRCIDSVRAAAEPRSAEIELIAVDNESTDGSYEALVAVRRPPFLVERFKERNIAAVRNHGAQLARGQFLCFLDSDVLIPPDYFDRAKEVLVSQGADATGCEVTVPSHASWVEETWAGLHRPGVDGLVHYINSANFIVSAEAFHAIGGFERGLTTGEDAEIGQRLCQRGYRIYQARSVSAVHLRNPKTLPAFFRKQLWHGRGMFGTVKMTALDKPVAMTVLHAILCIGGVAVLILPIGPFVARLACASGCSLVAPTAAVAYRYAKSGARPLRPLRSLVLYHLYFDARTVALGRILVDKVLALVSAGAHESSRA